MERKKVAKPRTGKIHGRAVNERSLKLVDLLASNVPPDEAAKIAGYQTEHPRVLSDRWHKSVKERKKAALEHCEVTPEMVMGATALRAFATIDDAFDENGNFSIQKARETGAIHLIKSIEHTRYGHKVTFYSNADAQDKLGNYLGMEKAPTENADVESLRIGIEEVAKAIAKSEGRDEVTKEDRHIAWDMTRNWVISNRAKYTMEAVREVGKEFLQ